MIKFIIFISLLIFGVNSFNPYATITCTTSFCQLALNPCQRCYGVSQCQRCIVSIEQLCQPCADEIYENKSILIGKSKYQMCSSKSDLGNKICHMFCRGYFYQTGSCMDLNDMVVCQCFVDFNSNFTLPTGQGLSVKLFKSYSVNPIEEPVKIKGLQNGFLAFGNKEIFILDTYRDEIVKILKSNLQSIQTLVSQKNGNLVTMSNFENVVNFWTPFEMNNPVRNFSLNGSCLTVLDNDDLVVCQDTKLKVVDNLDGSEKLALFGHDDLIYSVAALEDSRFISGSKDGTIRIWNYEFGTMEGEFNSSESSVTSLLDFKNGNIISGHSNGFIKVWNSLGEVVWTLDGHSHAVSSLARINNRYFISGSFDRFFKVWDLVDQSEKFSYQGSPIYGVEYFGNGFIGVTSYNKILIWEIHF